MNNDTSILSAIGNTPMVKLKHVVTKDHADIYVKLEYYNPTGSYKDRMALAIIEGAEATGRLKKGMTVVECTGGSTGTSLALVCSAKGYPFKVISSDAFAAEKLKSIKLFGGDLQLVASENGKITPDLIPKMMAMVEKLGLEKENYLTSQFKNTDALIGYRKMGEEILKQVGKNIHVFTASVGTAGMFTGVGLQLKEANSLTKLIPLEPASAPLISQGIKGAHKVDGIGVGFIPPLLENIKYDEIKSIDENDARSMAKLLAEKEGIFAGTSTGLNITGALHIARELGPGKIVVTVACDSGMKYLNGGLFD
jgi:cysteine synthase